MKIITSGSLASPGWQALFNHQVETLAPSGAPTDPTAMAKNVAKVLTPRLKDLPHEDLLALQREIVKLLARKDP